MQKFKKVFLLTCFVMAVFTVSLARADQLPEGFTKIKQSIPDAIIDLRYSGTDNFLGRVVNGYKDGNCIISVPAAQALSKVEDDLKTMGLGLKVFDAYRPQMSVDDFVEWAKNLNDTKMKKKYYPDVDKNNLFKDGYIMARSGHSRGSTVDLTIVGFDKDGKAHELDMGTGFDLFGLKSHPDYKGISDQARANRLLLRTLMLDHGFKPLAEEWWHFTLKEEPYPDTYFNFPIN